MEAEIAHTELNQETVALSTGRDGCERKMRWAALGVIVVGTLLISVLLLPGIQSGHSVWGHLGIGTAAASASSVQGSASKAASRRDILVAQLAAHDAERGALQAQLDALDAIETVSDEFQSSSESTLASPTFLPTTLTQLLPSLAPPLPSPSLQLLPAITGGPVAVLDIAGSCPTFEQSLERGGAARPKPSAEAGYILLHRSGGLGNQLFMVEAGVSAGLASGRTPLLGTAPDDNHHATMGYESSIFASFCMAPPNFSASFVIQPETILFEYQPVVFPGPKEAHVVETRGYRQNPRYLPPASVLAALFAPTPTLVAHLESAYGPLSQVLALHVRRGDYVGHADMGMPYYEAALRRAEAVGALASGVRLLIVSDDVVWVKAQPGFLRRGAVIVDAEDEVSTFYLLAIAGVGQICPNSTFCWGAAYLARALNLVAGRTNRFVVMPRSWHRGRNTSALHDGLFDTISDTEFVMERQK